MFISKQNSKKQLNGNQLHRILWISSSVVHANSALRWRKWTVQPDVSCWINFFGRHPISTHHIYTYSIELDPNYDSCSDSMHHHKSWTLDAILRHFALTASPTSWDLQGVTAALPFGTCASIMAFRAAWGSGTTACSQENAPHLWHIQLPLFTGYRSFCR